MGARLLGLQSVVQWVACSGSVPHSAINGLVPRHNGSVMDCIRDISSFCLGVVPRICITRVPGLVRKLKPLG